jgi:hypothetical protein
MELVMNSTHRLHSEPLERPNAEHADCIDFDQSAIHLAIEPHASELAQVLEETSKKLFCRLPRPLQVALQARVIHGGQSLVRSGTDWAPSL